MQALNRNQIWKIPFIPDRGTSAALNADNITLDFGRLVVELHSSGKVRLKIGSDGTKRFSEEFYVNDGIITRTDPITRAFGEIPAGTVLSDKSIYEALQLAYWAYQNIVLNSVSLSPSQLEIGYELNTNLTLGFNISNSSNLELGNAGSISSALVTNTTFDPRVTLNIASIPTTYNVPTTIPITITITGKNSEISTRVVNFSWLPRIIHLSNTNPSITDATTILAAGGGGTVLSNSRARDYNFTGGYSHFYFPSFVNITNIGFADIDINTNLPLFNYAVQQQSDIVINNGEISVTLKYFRSVNSFGGATRARVS